MEAKPTQARGTLQTRIPRFIFIFIFGGFATFFGAGFLGNFYPKLWQFAILTILLNTAFIMILDLIFTRFALKLKDTPSTYFISLSILALSLVMVSLTVRLLLQYPSIFSPGIFLPYRSFFQIFFIAIAASSSLTLFATQNKKWRDGQTSEFSSRLQRNIPGLLLASAMAISTFLLATAFRPTSIQQMDNYFDTDSMTWVNLLTARVENLMPLRAVHPLAFLIFRPPAWLVSFVLNGNKVYSAILLNSLTSGFCVYFTWLFFKKRTNNTTYALLMAALLGLSSSHLILGVFLESYIFSAAALIGFMLLLQADKRSLLSLVTVGVLSFGITITNFAQICIGYFFLNPGIKNLFKYIGLVLSISTLLVFVQHIYYPSSEPFYVPSNLLNEQKYGFNIFDSDARLIASRANVLARDVFLMNIVAPRPLILLEEVGGTFPSFNTIFQTNRAYRHAAYSKFGKVLARLWFASVVIAFFIFVRTLFKTPKQTVIQIALLANILFNFVLHMNYGDDLILYSPGWTYALIFFFGISYEGLSDNKWFQAILVIFLAGLFINNLELFRNILDAILPFVNFVK